MNCFVSLMVALEMLLGGWAAEPAAPHPVHAPQSPLMLQGDWVPDDPREIDFDRLPKIAGEHVVISDVRPGSQTSPYADLPKGGVNQHNYLTHFDGRFWAMWSDGPGVEDKVGQRVKFSTSADGREWSTPEFLTPIPPNSGPDSEFYATRTERGFRWISRGFWQREGELLALASLDEAAGFFGKSLALHAFRWNGEQRRWESAGVVANNAINNFPPKQIPTGDWMMSRRTHDYKKVGVEFLVGGRDALDAWQSYPVLGSSGELSAEEPLWWTLADQHLMALFRDNRRGGFLFRSFSTDNGKTWSPPTHTNFPDATSKIHGLKLSDGRYVLVSNSNPKKRDPLTIAVSHDGMVFTKLGYVAGGRHVDYPHVIEHDGKLFVAFATRKQTVEVVSFPLSELDRLQNPPRVAIKQDQQQQPDDEPQPVASRISVSTDFEGGSARVLGIDQSTRTIRFMPGGDPARGWNCWWSLKVHGVPAGEPLTLELLGSDLPTRNNGQVTDRPLSSSWAMPQQAAVSYDGATWEQTAKGTNRPPIMRYEVTGTGKPLWLAWGPSFTPQDTAALITAATRTLPSAKPFLLATTRGGRPVRGLHLQESKLPNPQVIWVEARQHAWESGASWVCRGFTEWVVSDDPDAVWLRAHAEIFIVPIMDVDNVATGNGGKEADPRDHNRDWDDAPVYPEVAAVQQKVREFTAAGRMHSFIDLHNPAPGDLRPFFFLGPSELLQAPAAQNREWFLAAAQERIAGPLKIEAKPRVTGPGYHPLWKQISCQWVNANANPHTLAVCLETAWNTPHSHTAGYLTVGQQLGLTLTDTLRQSLANVGGQ